MFNYLVNQDPTQETETTLRFYRREANANLITLVIEEVEEPTSASSGSLGINKRSWYLFLDERDREKRRCYQSPGNRVT